MSNEGYVKVEAEATINKNGQIVGWKDLESGPDSEYWSEASLSSIEENNKERARFIHQARRRSLENRADRAEQILPVFRRYFKLTKRRQSPRL